MIKILEELKEQIRRKKVLKGEWKESESKALLQQLVNDVYESMPPEKELKQHLRSFSDQIKLMKQLDTDKTLYEREYYFDEGLGESLDKHVSKIKADFPDIQVQVRRDRDGFAIVRTLHKPQYKYDIDSIISFDKDEA